MMEKVQISKHFNRTLILACLLIMISTFNFGFDNAGFNTTQAMNSFAKEFGEVNSKGKYSLPTVWLSLFNSLNYIGFGAGVIIGSFVSGRWGRRWCMFSMSVYALVSATICVTSNSKEQIMAGRVLNYVYIGMELSVVPVFQSEIVPAPVRGMAVGSYQFSLMLGTLIINCICRGTSTLEGNASWRIPIGLFYVIPSFIIAGIWFIPESPRWLLTRDRVEEARASLQKLREGTLTSTEIDEEFDMLQLALRLEPEQGKFIELFQGVNLKRTGIVIGMNFFQQATGSAFVSTYGTLYVKDLGTVNAFSFSIIVSCCNIFMVSIGLFLSDRLGRRSVLYLGGSLQLATIITIAALGTGTPTYATKTGIVALLAVFSGAFVFGWAPICYVVTTEVPALRLRDASQRTAAIVFVVTSFVVNFTIPYLLNAPYAHLGSKLGFIFGGVSLCALVFTYFCVPECKGKTLEQVERLFNDEVPLRHFGRYGHDSAAAYLDQEKGTDGVEVAHAEKS